MDTRDLLPMGEITRRSGFAASAIRYYEAEGLIEADRSAGGQRRFERNVLRRLAFIRAASNVGLTIEEIRDELARLPGNRTPTKADWQRISRHWRPAARRPDRRARAPQGRPRLLHRLRLPEPAQLCLLQPRATSSPTRARRRAAARLAAPPASDASIGSSNAPHPRSDRVGRPGAQGVRRVGPGRTRSRVGGPAPPGPARAGPGSRADRAGRGRRASRRRDVAHGRRTADR